MKYYIIVSMLLLTVLQSCMQANDSFLPVASVEQARKIADSRFTAQSKALNSEVSQIPEPIVDTREKDYLFTYENKIANKKIIVIVGKDGGVADSYE